MKVISFLLLFSACASQEKDTSPTALFNRQLQQCYEESDSVYMKPPVEGKMKYSLSVAPDGAVKAAKILESDFSKDRNFEACITGEMKRGTIKRNGLVGIEEHIIPISFQRKKL